MRRLRHDEDGAAPAAPSRTLIGVIEELMMGAYSTTPQRSATPQRPENLHDPVDSDVEAPVAEVGPPAEAAPARTLSAIASKASAWLFFVGGIVGAVLGIAGLHVEITVAGLILACTAGLVLLKLRTEGQNTTTD